MKFPDNPTCHAKDPRFLNDPIVWRPPFQEIHWRTCSYCGSMHPEDLIRFLQLPQKDTATCARCRSESTPEPNVPENPSDEQLQAWQSWERGRYSPHTCRVTLGDSDWKYGWPHKFYVEGIPNPTAGKISQYGTHSYTDENGKRHEEKLMGPEPATRGGKWYNQHLLDQGYDDDALDLLLGLLSEHSGITFLKGDDGQLKYRAPYPGYQQA